MFSALNKKELRSLHQKAKSYLEKCLEENQKRTNDSDANKGNALAALLTQPPEAGSDRFLDEIQRILQPKRHSEL